MDTTTHKITGLRRALRTVAGGVAVAAAVVAVAPAPAAARPGAGEMTFGEVLWRGETLDSECNTTPGKVSLRSDGTVAADWTPTDWKVPNANGPRYIHGCFLVISVTTPAGYTWAVDAPVARGTLKKSEGGLQASVKVQATVGMLQSTSNGMDWRPYEPGSRATYSLTDQSSPSEGPWVTQPVGDQSAVSRPCNTTKDLRLLIYTQYLVTVAGQKPTHFTNDGGGQPNVQARLKLAPC
ncbi:hypothetical protein GCM10010124_05940 [Pilimelia terevasa]|uniref:Uncharacterized protein n=1 Tax=Pilimelia terevasa TaxID=53372 RepID=A0A8J3BI96_9ACTN|nr:hypothetical protein [Pilimelia terevasa]GGK16126.1 hypothetical protein GCM10010124_05940 [Pilimelia terevasa]